GDVLVAATGRVADAREPARRGPAQYHRLRGVGKLRDAAHTEPQVVVLGNGERLVVSAYQIDHGAPEHHGGVDERVRAHERAPKRTVVGGRHERLDHPP